MGGMTLEFVAVLEDRQEANPSRPPPASPSACHERDSSRIWPTAATGPSTGHRGPGAGREPPLVHGNHLTSVGPNPDPHIGRCQEGQFDLAFVPQDVLRPTVEIHPQVEMGRIEPEAQPRDHQLPRRRDPVHRPDGRLEFQLPRADPLEVAGHLAVDGWGHEPARGMRRHPRRRGGDVGQEQLLGHWLVQALVDVAQVPAEQVVELQVVVREWSSPYHQNQSDPSAM